MERSSVLSDMFGAEVYLKCEHLQHTGSFKLRGALNKLITLQQETAGIKLNVIAASTGNHGLAVAYAANRLNIQATIYLPESTSQGKQTAIRALGASIVLVKGDCLQAENEARSHSVASGKPYISPYNDSDIVAGQGTIGLELSQQLTGIDAVFVSVGGGGLISGVAAYLKDINPHTQIIGCWPENASAMLECIKAGRIIEVPEQPTLSSSTAGGLEANSITFPLCQNLIDNYACVSEKEIKHGIKFIAEHDRWLVEGAAGTAVATFLKLGTNYRGKKVVILLCGRNISLDQVKEVFS